MASFGDQVKIRVSRSLLAAEDRDWKSQKDGQKACQGLIPLLYRSFQDSLCSFVGGSGSQCNLLRVALFHPASFAWTLSGILREDEKKKKKCFSTSKWVLFNWSMKKSAYKRNRSNQTCRKPCKTKKTWRSKTPFLYGVELEARVNDQ